MSTKDKIERIIADRYGNYKGAMFAQLKDIHAQIRKDTGDENFLQFLTRLQSINPRPIYIIPEQK